MTKKTYIIIAVIAMIAIAGAVWWSGMEKVEAPEMPEIAAPVDTTDAIQDDLGKIDIGNVDADFTEVDQTIKSL